MKRRDETRTGAPEGTSGDPVSDARWAARLLHQAARPQPLSPGELEAIGAGLRLRTSATPARPPYWFWRVATAIFLLLCGGGLMAATVHILRGPPEPASAPNPSPSSQASAPVRAAVPQPESAAPPPIEAPVLEAPAEPRSVPRVATARPGAIIEIEPPPAAPVAAPLPSALREEAALLASALRRLREGNDAAGALALLDEHDRRFGTAGVLGAEVSATRLETWLRTGHHDRALAVLDGRARRPVGAARMLLAARADLRAEAGRCPEARADFDLLLANDGATDTIGERALFGRASCLSREGDTAAARIDLEQYLSRFPAGTFAARARAALAR